MRERPILFSGPMVRASLSGDKTQTRRLVTVPWAKGSRARPYEPYYTDSDGVLKMADEYGDWHTFAERVACPFGAVGDRLYVRETWAALQLSYDYESGHCEEVENLGSIPRTDPRTKDGGVFSRPRYTVAYRSDDRWEARREDRGFDWTPSIHMPRWASRLFLEVTGVRVERLQAITEADAWAEGVAECANALDDAAICARAKAMGACIDDARPSFAALWDSLYGAKPGQSWDDSPWVWVVEFRRVAP